MKGENADGLTEHFLGKGKAPAAPPEIGKKENVGGGSGARANVDQVIEELRMRQEEAQVTLAKLSAEKLAAEEQLKRLDSDNARFAILEKKAMENLEKWEKTVKSLEKMEETAVNLKELRELGIPKLNQLNQAVVEMTTLLDRVGQQPPQENAEQVSCWTVLFHGRRGRQVPPFEGLHNVVGAFVALLTLVFISQCNKTWSWGIGSVSLLGFWWALIASCWFPDARRYGLGVGYMGLLILLGFYLYVCLPADSPSLSSLY